jgi:hypothetical protein
MKILKSSMILSSLFLICFLSCACDNDRLPNLWQPSDRDRISLQELEQVAQARDQKNKNDYEKLFLAEQQLNQEDQENAEVQISVSIEKKQLSLWSIICYVVGWKS